jgi:hypothetical protein
MFAATNRPLKLHEVITESLRLFKHSYGKVFFLGLVISIMDTLGMIGGSIFSNINALAGIVIIAVALVLGIAAYATLVKRVHNILNHDSVPANFMSGLKRFWPLLAAVIIGVIATIIAYGFLILPGIFLNICLFIYLPMVVLGEAGPFNGITKSISLTWGHWWKTLLIVLTTAFICIAIYAVLLVIIVGIPAFLTGFTNSTLIAVLMDVVHVISGTLFYPFLISVALVLLRNFKAQ